MAYQPPTVRDASPTPGDADTSPPTVSCGAAFTAADSEEKIFPGDTQPKRADGATLQKRPSRVRDVSPRDLSTMANAWELLAGIFCAVVAHKEIYERENELHGNINPNSIVLFDHPGEERPWDSPGRTAGAMIYWEPPISIQTLRKIGNPDHPQPPPQRCREYMGPPLGYRRYYA